MSLKDVAENHPIAVLVTVAIAAGSLAGGTTTYLTSASYELQKKEIQIENQQKVKDLESRLVSIERKLGQEISFFDVTKILQTTSSIRSLNTNYSGYEGGLFFVDDPDDESWKYEETTEMFLLTETMGELPDQLAKIFDALLKASPRLHLWRSEDSFTTKLALNKGMVESFPTSLKFFPYIVVQVFTEEDFKRIGASIDKLAEEEERELASELASIQKQLENEEKESTAIEDKSANTLDDSVRLRAEEIMGDMFRRDLAALMLGQILQSTQMFPLLYQDVLVGVGSAQKKGNVMYVQLEAKFGSATIEEQPNASSFYLFQEWFFVSTLNYAILVKTQIPSTERRSPAFSWVAQWLAGLRIPAEAQL